METAWFWGGTTLMGIGTIAFSLKSLRARAEDRHHYLSSILIVLIALASYSAMAIGQTHLLLSDGHSVYIARYLDWLLTTPLLLLGLATYGMRTMSVNKTLVYAAIGTDIYMIATGLAGALSTDNWRWMWYAYSCIAFVAVLALVWGPIRAEAVACKRDSTYLKLSGLLTILWIQYPIVWLLGEEGLRTIGSPAETVWFMILDVLAKVGFGAYLLAAVDKAAPALENGGRVVQRESDRREIPAMR